jgi:hypothetical protein
LRSTVVGLVAIGGRRSGTVRRSPLAGGPTIEIIALCLRLCPSTGASPRSVPSKI